MTNIKVFARPRFVCEDLNALKLEDKKIYICDAQRGQVRCTDLEGDRDFTFEHVFGLESSQREVFEVAARDVVEAFLGGFNGCIVVYGQTRSGKSYTLEGDGSEGLIPASLKLIFDKAHKLPGHDSTISVSHMEIQSEAAYDLLGTLMYLGNYETELPQVLITTGPSRSGIHLSQKVVTSYQEAMQLHCLGVSRRHMLHPKGWGSSVSSGDSHTVFTVHLSRQLDSTVPVILSAQLHMVDLAGSQAGQGSTAEEPKHANASLDHLEDVVRALQATPLTPLPLSGTDSSCLQRTVAVNEAPNGSEVWCEAAMHPQQCGPAECALPDVPYRNSRLTMVLQDSFGGNSRTVMIMTLLPGREHLQETISSCAFAQKVSRIVNMPQRNQRVDKTAFIEKLKAQLAAYENPGACHCSPLESGDLERCVRLTESFINGKITDPVAKGVNTPEKFETCLRYLRTKLWDHQARGPGAYATGSEDCDSGFRMSSDSDIESKLGDSPSRKPDVLDDLAGPTEIHQPQSTSATKNSVNAEHAPTSEDRRPNNREHDEVAIKELMEDELMKPRRQALSSTRGGQQDRLASVCSEGADDLEGQNENMIERQKRNRQIDAVQEKRFSPASQTRPETEGRAYACADSGHEAPQQRNDRAEGDLGRKLRATRLRLLSRRQDLARLRDSPPSPPSSSCASARSSLVEGSGGLKAIPLVRPRPATVEAPVYRRAREANRIGSVARLPRKVSSAGTGSSIKRREKHGRWSERQTNLFPVKCGESLTVPAGSFHGNFRKVALTTSGACEHSKEVCAVSRGRFSDISLLERLYKCDPLIYRTSSFPVRALIDVSSAPYEANSRANDGWPISAKRNGDLDHASTPKGTEDAAEKSEWTRVPRDSFTETNRVRARQTFDNLKTRAGRTDTERTKKNSETERVNLQPDIEVILHEARSHKIRASRVRRVLWAAQVIQGAWRQHLLRKSRKMEN